MAMRKRVPRGGFVPEESGEDEEVAEIYITLRDWKRLRDDSPWFQDAPYAAILSGVSLFRVCVPLRALKDCLFRPDQTTSKSG